MGVFLVTGQCFHGMTDGMPVIKHGAKSSFFFVFFHNRRFYGTGALYHRQKSVLIPVQQSAGIGGDEIKQVSIQNYAVFYYLSQAAQILTFREGFARNRIDKDKTGLIESAY